MRGPGVERIQAQRRTRRYLHCEVRSRTSDVAAVARWCHLRAHRRVDDGPGPADRHVRRPRAGALGLHGRGRGLHPRVDPLSDDLQPGVPRLGQRRVAGQLVVHHRLSGHGRTGLHRTVDRQPRRPLHPGHAGGRDLRRHRGRPADAARHRHLRPGPHRGHRLGPGSAGRRVRRVHRRLRLDDRRGQLHLRPHRRLVERTDQFHPGARLAQRVLRRSGDGRGRLLGRDLRGDLLAGDALRRQHPAGRAGRRVLEVGLARAPHPPCRVAGPHRRLQRPGPAPGGGDRPRPQHRPDRFALLRPPGGLRVRRRAGHGHRARVRPSRAPTSAPPRPPTCSAPRSCGSPAASTSSTGSTPRAAPIRSRGWPTGAA